MTVKELIEKLKELPGDTEVKITVQGDDGEMEIDAKGIYYNASFGEVQIQ